MSILVIGAGQAAAEFAITLRAGGFAAPIRIVGDEPYLPYQRPPLSKEYLAGKSGEEKLFLRPENFWRGQKVEFLPGTAVEKIDRAAKRVSLAGGPRLDYETLVLATGTSARLPVAPGIDLPCVFPLRRIDDVKRLRAAIDRAGIVARLLWQQAWPEARNQFLFLRLNRIWKKLLPRLIKGFNAENCTVL